jgi:hypothetical protein
MRRKDSSRMSPQKIIQKELPQDSASKAPNEMKCFNKEFKEFKELIIEMSLTLSKNAEHEKTRQEMIKEWTGQSEVLMVIRLSSF